MLGFVLIIMLCCTALMCILYIVSIERKAECVLPDYASWDVDHVCIIGNGPSVLRQKRAASINRCDLVIRMNDFAVKGYA